MSGNGGWRRSWRRPMTDTRLNWPSAYVNAAYMRRVLVLIRHRQDHKGPPRRVEVLTRSLMAEVQDWIPPRLYHPLRRRIEAWMEEHVVAEEHRVTHARNEKVRAIAAKLRDEDAID